MPDPSPTTMPTTQPASPALRYGWLSVTPPGLQALNKAGVFLLCISLANMFQSMTINGLIGVVLSSLETRFGFTSFQSSWIASTYDVSTIPVLVVVSYLGARSHRPRWTAAGLFMLVVGTAIFIVPHFATPVYRPGATAADAGAAVWAVEEDDGLCLSPGATRPGGDGEANDYSGFLAVFIVGRALHGMGAVPLYTVAVTYLDDCVTKEHFSLYIAIFYAAGVLGPALGYIVGGFLLTVFTDFYSVADSEIGIESSSPRWVGAWWIGFLAGAIALLLITIPMFGFPRDLPGAAEVRAGKISEAYNKCNGEEEEEDEMGGTKIDVDIREMLRYFKDLALNPTYVFLTLMVACDSLLIAGFTAFGPKYVQEQFHVTAALSGMMFGIVVIPGGAGGTIAGGIIVKKMALKCGQIMKTEMVFSVAVLVTGFMFLIICDPINFVGITVGYNNTAALASPDFRAACNADCGCESVPFTPICSVANLQYYSPCYAGCTADSPDKTSFHNCSCITESVNLTGSAGPAATTKPCTTSDCTLVPLFMVIFFCAMFCLFACSGMNISATVRCLPASHRSLGIGMQWIFLRLLGTVPGPLLFGAAFDASCEVFSKQTDGTNGQCLFYDTNRMAWLLLAICFGVKLLSLVCITLAWWLYKPPTRTSRCVVVDAPKDGTALGSKVVNNLGYTSDIIVRPGAVSNSGFCTSVDSVYTTHL